MIRVPSFNHREELTQAVLTVLNQTQHSVLNDDEPFINFIVEYLMSDKVASQSSRIRTFRHFSSLVSRQCDEVRLRLNEYDKLTHTLIQAYGGDYLRLEEELASSIKSKFFGPRGVEVLLGAHHRSYVRQQIEWWLRSEFDKYMIRTHKRVDLSDAELKAENKDPADYKTRPKKRVSRFVREHETNDEKTSAQIWDTDLDESSKNILDSIVETESEELIASRILKVILTLPKKRRSALISRLWDDLAPYGDKRMLASYIHSPLTIDERIERLDQIIDDQQRMVTVAFPDLGEGRERTQKLETLNRASTHGLSAMQKAFKESEHD